MSLRGFGWNNVGPASQPLVQHYISIGQCYLVFLAPGCRVIWCFWRRGGKRHRIIMQLSETMVQSPNAVSMSGQRRRLWFNIKTSLGECRVFAQSIGAYSRHSDGLVLGKRRRRLTGIEPAMGCVADQLST